MIGKNSSVLLRRLATRLGLETDDEVTGDCVTVRRHGGFHHRRVVAVFQFDRTWFAGVWSGFPG